jgi:hypothetical protein
MSDYRDQIRCLVDPDQAERLADGSRLQQVSVVMTDDPSLDAQRERPPLRAAIVTLTPAAARELAFELLVVAEQAERQSTQRRRR